MGTPEAADVSRHGFHEPDAPYDAVATPPTPLPTGAAPNGKFFQADGVSQLENLWVCHAGVRHVAVNGEAPVDAGSCTGPAANGLVVLPVGIAEQKVVHGRLAAGQCPNGAEQGVTHGLRYFGIAGNDSGARLRRQEATHGNLDLN